MNKIESHRISISFTPTSKQLTEIYGWLKEEETQERFAGLFCNWNSIEYSFERNEIAIIYVKGFPVGFMTWLIAEKTAKIQLAEIKPDHRKQGLAKMLTNTVLDHFRDLGIFAVRLHCQPQKSEFAWKKIGFRNFPEVEEMQLFNNEEEGRHLYQILIPYMEAQEFAKTGETLELWPVESYMSDKVSPKWSWDLEFNQDSLELINPIIAPAKYKWNMRWKRDGQVVKERDIKYFSKTGIYFDTFLMITKLNE